jgi:hypothetical protein
LASVADACTVVFAPAGKPRIDTATGTSVGASDGSTVITAAGPLGADPSLQAVASRTAAMISRPVLPPGIPTREW